MTNHRVQLVNAFPGTSFCKAFDHRKVFIEIFLLKNFIETLLKLRLKKLHFILSIHGTFIIKRMYDCMKRNCSKIYDQLATIENQSPNSSKLSNNSVHFFSQLFKETVP
jgi:hypothetical protein